MEGCERVKEGRSVGVGRCEGRGASWSRRSDRPLDATLGVLAVDPRGSPIEASNGRSDSDVNR